MGAAKHSQREFTEQKGRSFGKVFAQIQHNPTSSLGKAGLSDRTHSPSLSYQLAVLCHLCNHRLEEAWGPSLSSHSLIYSGWYVALGLEKAGVLPPVVGVGPDASPSTCLWCYIRAQTPHLFLITLKFTMLRLLSSLLLVAFGKPSACLMSPCCISLEVPEI